MARVIAEITNAHQGCPQTLKQLIQAASTSKADAVKFQWFKYDHLATSDYPWYEAYKGLFIHEGQWKEVLRLAKSLGLSIWVDVLDDWGVHMLRSYETWIDGIKLPATVLQSRVMIESLSFWKKPVLLGVGGWLDDEIDRLLPLLKKRVGNHLTLLHGFQGYPTHLEDAGLARIPLLQARYGYPVGYADHTDGSHPLAIELPIYAYFSGAGVIEKHITLQRSQKGYNYDSSLEPAEFATMVHRLKTAAVIMGDGEVTDAQRSYLKDAVRVVATQPIVKGEIITQRKVSYKRCPDNNGIMPQELESLLPVISQQAVAVDQVFSTNSIKKPVIVIAVITRLKSTRLTKKALRFIHGVTAIERCLLNCLSVPGVDHVVLATSDLPQDKELTNMTMNGEVEVFCGDAENVVQRMMDVAKLKHADIILRVTGDCPAISPEILEYLIQHHLEQGCDFTTATENHALGTCGDVITVEAFERLLQHPKPLTHTEYLSAYFRNNPHLFTSHVVELPPVFQYPNWRLTLDEPLDLSMFEELYRGLQVGYEPLPFARIRPYLLAHPHVLAINANVQVKYQVDEKLVRQIKKETTLDGSA
ncbi:N-acetylneuraminate synthase family protein [Marininema halotolerans]|uniref:N,N'-diacetyllegionaminate synthase n=1 Tax=Marininema halotolerans TaxID=1155944 RepID=A0A1I6NVD3_9BACL|nr:N-acetylneuraminate synthase family protein [Marininema halotolerans]SFS31808.1 N,N'-diacetyllegionaminate synthase [Marininema halotolerans]